MRLGATVLPFRDEFTSGHIQGFLVMPTRFGLRLMKSWN